jgi:peptide/nickel transport system permease protein
MNEFVVRLTAGAFHSILLAVISVILCMPIAVLAALAMRKKTKLTSALVYSLDVFISLPNNVLLITLAGILGGSPFALLLSVFITQIPGMIRHFRVHFLRAYSDAHVDAAVALGVGPNRIFWKHVLPRLWAPLSISAVTLMKRVILSESLITFLGLGFDPLTPSLGRLISEGREALFLDPVYFLAPVGVLASCLYVLQKFSDRFSSLYRSRGIRYL